MTSRDLNDLGMHSERRLWRPEEVADLKIPDAAKEYLSTAGLPLRLESLCLNFASAVGPLERIPGRQHLRILTAEPPHLCIDESFPGQVVAIGFGQSEAFVNSSVESLGGFLNLYEDFQHVSWNRTEGERAALARQLRNEMQRVDAFAFSRAESYWPQVFEQMEAGLL